MTQKEMKAHLINVGVRKAFQPYFEEGRVMPGNFLLKTRPPFDIVNGRLVGGEIVCRGNDFLVWTPKVRLARRIAKEHRLTLRELDGESELYVPANLADEILPKFGARVKRACFLTPEQRESARARMRFLHSRQDIQSTSGQPSSAGLVSIPSGLSKAQKPDICHKSKSFGG